MKKTLTAIALLAGMSGVAQADPIYLDVGLDFGGNSNTAAGSTTTGWVDTLTYKYQSESTIVDLDNSFDGLDADTLLTDGDSIVTNGGFTDLSSLEFNGITGLNPGETIFGGPSNNGLNTNWGLTFKIENLVGTVSGSGASQYLDYETGDISFFYYDGSMSSTSDFVELFTISLQSSGALASTGPYFSGNISSYGTGTVNGVAAGDVFNSIYGGFEEFALSTTAPDLAGFAFVDYNTNPDTATFTPTGQNSNGNLIITATGEHNGSIAFDVPEPTSLGLFGAALLGLAGVARRRK
jgi:hypothetical protein